MWLKKLFNIINSSIRQKTLSAEEETALLNLNPDRFYIENVRSLLGISHTEAIRVCETAVRQGVFKRGIEILAPDGSVVASAESEADLPRRVQFWMDEGGHHEEAEADAATLQKQSFYRLIDEPVSSQHHA